MSNERWAMSDEQWAVSDERWAVSDEYTNVILTIPHSKNIRCFRWAKANNSFQDLSAEKDKKRLTVRCWNLRLSESRDMLAWTLPSVSKLNNVKQVQHDEMITNMRRENVGTSACSVRSLLTQIAPIPPKGLDISIELGRPKMDVEITDFPSEKKYL